MAWQDIAGAVVGGIVGLFAPAAGAVVERTITGGLNVATDVVNKIRSQKEVGKSDQQIAASLTTQEKAALVADANEAAAAAAATDAYFQAWINSQSASDKKLSLWRKKAKMQGLNPNDPQTFKATSTTLSWGGETINKDDLVIFAGFPDFKDSNEIIEEAQGGETSPGELLENANMEEITGQGIQVDDDNENPLITPASTPGRAGVWFFLLMLAGAVWWFFVTMPAQKRKKRTEKARRALARKRKEEEEAKKTVRKQTTTRSRTKK